MQTVKSDQLISQFDQLVVHVTSSQPPQDPLDAALAQAKKRREESDREMLNLERKFFISIGKRSYQLGLRKETLQNELLIKQHSVTVLPKLNQELWIVHLESTRVSVGALAGVINDFVKVFQDFQAIFPAEAISQTPENAIPTLRWLTTIKTFVNERPEKYLLPQKPEMVHELIRVELDPSLVQAQSILGVVPYLQELHSLEEHVANMQRDLSLLDKEEQELKKHNAQMIESWNAFFTPYLDVARVFQEKLVTFLRQQDISLKQKSSESYLTFANVLWYFNPMQAKRGLNQVINII